MKILKMSEEEKKKFNKKLLIGMILGFISGSLGSMLGFSLAVHSPLVGQDSIKSYLMKDKFSEVSEIWQNSGIVTSLSEVCSLKDSDVGKIICVHNYVCKHFKYLDIDKRSSNRLQSSPEKLILYGGVCRDWAVFYKSVFDSMNFNNSLVITQEGTHIYNLVYLENDTIKVDQTEVSSEKKEWSYSC